MGKNPFITSCLIIMEKREDHLNKYKIAIVGSREEILCFKAVGVDIFPIKNIKEATEKLFELKKERQSDDENSPPKFAIIFVMENILKEISADDFKKLSIGALPAITSLPGHSGSTGYGDTKIRQLVEKAVGSDIFGN